jgi:hypothetical protein
VFASVLLVSLVMLVMSVSILSFKEVASAISVQDLTILPLLLSLQFAPTTAVFVMDILVMEQFVSVDMEKLDLLATSFAEVFVKQVSLVLVMAPAQQLMALALVLPQSNLVSGILQQTVLRAFLNILAVQVATNCVPPISSATSALLLQTANVLMEFVSANLPSVVLLAT